MRGRASAGLAAFAFLACAASAQADRLITPIRGTTTELRVDGEEVAVRIPVDVAEGVCVRDLRVTVVSVGLGQRLDKGITDAFAARIARGGRRTPALVLTVTVNPGLDDGTYSVLLDVRDSTSADRRQRLKLMVIHPSAKLRPPALLRVERTSEFLWGFFKGETKSSPLPLRENGGKSKLSDVDVFQVENPTGSAGDGELVFQNVPDVSPSSRERVPYELSGTFGLGTTTGLLEIEAPQLESPVSVAFEVKRRIHPAYIALIALIGVGLGYVLRVWLKRVTERSRARLAGIELVELMEQEIDERKDEHFRTEVRDALGTLRNKLRSEKDPQQLSAAVTAARQAFDTALKDLDSAREQAQAAFERLQTTVETPWIAPPEVKEALSSAQAGLSGVERKLAAYDATGAEEKTAAAEEKLRSDLRPVLADWQADLRNLLHALKQVELPAQLAAELQASSSQLEQELQGSTIDAPEPDLDKALAAVHAGEVIRERLLREDLPRLGLVSGEVATALSDAGLSANGALRDRQQGLLEALNAAARHEGELDAVADAVRALTSALRDLLLDQAPEAVREEIGRLLDQGDYERAARILADSARTELADDELLGEAAAGASAARAPAAAWIGLAADAAAPMLARVTHTRVRERDPLAGLRGLRFLSLLESIEASFWRTLIIALVVAAGALAAFQANWDGSLDEVIAVFFWGFGLDFSIESAIDIARGAKQEEQAAAKA